MTDLQKRLEAKRDAGAAKQRIYEPKYGGKDHSGYETLMKYEVNYEREEAFEAGANAFIPMIVELADALDESCMCTYHEVAKSDWVSRMAVYDQCAACMAMEKLSAWLECAHFNKVAGKMSEKKAGYEIVRLSEVEKKTILNALHLYKWNRSQAALALGISIRTLRNKLRQYGINGPVQQSEKL